jgi:hypothetical protein
MGGFMDQGSTTSKQSDIQTSQQRAGEHHLAEGSGGGATSGPNAFGSDKAPTGLSTSTAMSMENQLKTTQQVKNEFSLGES